MTLEQKAKARTYVSPHAQVLRGFRHASRTNIKKGTLTNRDAICILLYVHGRMTNRDVQAAMLTWRYGKAEFEVYEYYRDDVKRDKLELCKGVRMRALLSAYFNEYYGHVGPNATKSGHEVEEYSYTRNSCYTWFQRYLWYRPLRGHYAVTVEGIKRISELLGQGLTLVAGEVTLKAA